MPEPDAAPNGVHGWLLPREAQPRLVASRSMPTVARIADMDFEGVDVNLTLPSGWFGTWSAGDDITSKWRCTAPITVMADYLWRLSAPARRRDPRRRAAISGAASPS